MSANETAAQDLSDGVLLLVRLGGTIVDVFASVGVRQINSAARDLAFFAGRYAQAAPSDFIDEYGSELDQSPDAFSVEAVHLG